MQAGVERVSVLLAGVKRRKRPAVLLKLARGENVVPIRKPRECERERI